MFKQDLSQLNEVELIELQQRFKRWRNFGLILLFLHTILTVFYSFTHSEALISLESIYWLILPFIIMGFFLFLPGYRFIRVKKELKSRGQE